MTSFFFQEARGKSIGPWANGEATNADLWAAARDSMAYVDNVNSAAAALEAAYDEWIGRVQDATGVELKNPMITAAFKSERDEIFPNLRRRYDIVTGATEEFGQERASFASKVSEIAAGNDAIGADWAVFDPDARAIEIAGQADARFAQVMASRDDWWKFAASFGGSMHGSLNDPYQAATLLVGGGVGAGKTAIARILSVAGREAALNAGVEAALQPTVQAWRKEVGLEHGFDVAAQNVAFAAAGGAVLGGGLHGLAEGARGLGRWAVGNPRGDAVLNGTDLDASTESLAPIREALSPEGRGALDMAEKFKLEEDALAELGDVQAYDDLRPVADRAAEGDLDALAEIEKRPLDVSPHAADTSPTGLDDPFAAEVLDSFTARFGEAFDDETLMRPALDPETGDVVPLADLMESVTRNEGLSQLVKACRI